MDLLRHGGMARVFDGVRAPSTLGTFLRLFTFGHVRQLDAVAARPAGPAGRRRPRCCPAPSRSMFVDIDDTVRQTYGYAKQGAGRGYTGVKGLNALLAVVSTPTSAPVIAATRLRKGSTNSARGAAKLLADALATARRAGAAGHGAGAGGLGLLRLRHHRRLPPGRGPVLDHRPAHPGRGQGHHRHRRARLDPDPLPERDLRRGRAAVGLRRRGRRTCSPRSPAAASASTSPPG